ncbi:MAG TPA: ribosome maturation factor RimM [Actinomycetales bacterium]
MQRVVARVGRAHGLRGEVSAEVRTDVPEQRFVAGAVFETDPAARGPLTLDAARDHSGVMLLRFAGVTTREGAEALRGTELLLDVEASDEPDAWYEHELVGLRVLHVDGTELGTVARLDAGAAQDLLVVTPAGGGAEVLVPFVSALVPVVDVAGGRVVLDPPGGMFGPDADEDDDSDDSDDDHADVAGLPSGG